MDGWHSSTLSTAACSWVLHSTITVSPEVVIPSVHSIAHISTNCGRSPERRNPHLWTELWIVKWIHGHFLWRTPPDLVTDHMDVIPVLPTSPTLPTNVVHLRIHRMNSLHPPIQALVHSFHSSY